MKEFNFYFAGTQMKDVEEYKVANGMNNLKSWFLERKQLEELISYKKDGKYTGKIMVDSGAFTAHRKNVVIDCDSYISWLNENEPFLECYVQLDKIPGKWGRARTREDIKEAQEASWNNYCYMVSKIKNPFKLLPVFHQDEDFSCLRRILDFKIDGKPVPYICISGAKDRTAKDRRSWYHECFQIIRSSENKNVRVHCLGCSTYQDLSLFPFYSSDSTTWLQLSNVGNIQDENAVSVSDNALKDCNNSARFKKLLPIIEQRCKRFGIDCAQLKVSYSARSIYNIRFMLEWCDKNIRKRDQIRIENRRLF